MIENSDQKRDLPKHGASIVLVVILLGVVFWLFDVDEIQAFVERGGIWGPIVFVIAKASTIIIAPISGSAIYPMAGAIFGFWKGFLLTFLGDALGSAVAFWISRHFGTKVARRFLGTGDSGYLTYILDHLNSWRGLIEARVCFAALPEAVAYAAGLSKLPFWKFFFVQMGLGAPTIALTVYFGSLLHLTDNPLIMGLILGAGSIAMLAGGSLFALQVKRRMDREKSAS